MPLAALLELVRVHREVGRLTPPDPLSIAECARLTNVSVSTVVSAIDRGELPVFTRGGGPRRWVWRRDVEAWQAGREPRPAESPHEPEVGP
jgi:excisionase family DNA binding protein